MYFEISEKDQQKFWNCFLVNAAPFCINAAIFSEKKLIWAGPINPIITHILKYQHP